RPVPPEQRNFFYRGFNRVYDPIERAYVRVIGGLADHTGITVTGALIIAGLGVWGIARIPTAFIPIEDQGYVMVGIQLPDGAALGRTQAVMSEVTKLAQATPGVDSVI